MSDPSAIRRLVDLLDKRLEEVIAGTCVCVMTILVFFQVVMRYVFSAPTSWSDEIAVYCMIWSVYLSCAWAVRERAHIRVMNFINLFPRPVATGLTVVSDVIWFGLCVFLTWQGLVLEQSLWEMRFESPALGIDQKWPYLAIAVGFGLTTLRLVQVYYRWLRHGQPLLEVPGGDVDRGLLHE